MKREEVKRDVAAESVTTVSRLALASPALHAVLACLANAAAGGSAESRPLPDVANPFAVVFIDQKTEAALGPFPYDRSVYAKAVTRAAELGCRGVVIKLFLDRPRSESGDRSLAVAMAKTKVILQAAVDESGRRPNDLPDRFTLKDIPPGSAASISGQHGVLPLSRFTDQAYDIGFINYRTIDRMPAIEEYRGRYVKSLFISCVELATGRTARVIPGNSVRLGNKSISLDESSQFAVRYPPRDDLQSISLADFLDRHSHPEVRDRIVILAHDGKTLALIETPAGKIRPHRAFCYALFSLYEQAR